MFYSDIIPDILSFTENYNFLLNNIVVFWLPKKKKMANQPFFHVHVFVLGGLTSRQRHCAEREIMRFPLASAQSGATICHKGETRSKNVGETWNIRSKNWKTSEFFFSYRVYNKENANEKTKVTIWQRPSLSGNEFRREATSHGVRDNGSDRSQKDKSEQPCFKPTIYPDKKCRDKCRQSCHSPFTTSHEPFFLLPTRCMMFACRRYSKARSMVRGESPSLSARAFTDISGFSSRHCTTSLWVLFIPTFNPTLFPTLFPTFCRLLKIITLYWMILQYFWLFKKKKGGELPFSMSMSSFWGAKVASATPRGARNHA